MAAPSDNDARERRPQVIILRGHQPNPWELRPWEQQPITDHFEVSYLRSRRGWFDTGSLALRPRHVWTMRDLLPPGRAGDLAVRVPGDRYLGLAAVLRDADIVHAQELGYWYSMQAAKLKARLGFRLVLTVWETIPFLRTYRNVRTRSYRSATLAQTDLFLAATERARLSLLLEGVPAERIMVCPPGIDTRRFRPAAARSPSGTVVILSPGRLVWEKGHQDVLRALALLSRGLLDEGKAGAGSRGLERLRVVVVGAGSEFPRLLAYARELGIAELVDFRASVPYDEMPDVFAAAACVVLASLPVWYWEEQFGMVLAEAAASGAPIVASTSGAIPEVAGPDASYFSPGDWVGLAKRLSEVLQGRQGQGRSPAGVDDERFSTGAAAGRLADAYARVLAPG